MRDKIEWHLRPIDRALASVLSAVLRVLAQKEPRQRDLKPDVPQHVCQLMHRVFSRMRPPFIVRIVVAGRSQSIVGRSTDQQLEDITDASDIRSRDHEMAAGLQTSIGFRQQMKGEVRCSTISNANTSCAELSGSGTFSWYPLEENCCPAGSRLTVRISTSASRFMN
jgi:hypothetical protein